MKLEKIEAATLQYEADGEATLRLKGAANIIEETPNGIEI